MIPGRKDEDTAADIIDIPKRTSPAKGNLVDTYCEEKSPFIPPLLHVFHSRIGSPTSFSLSRLLFFFFSGYELLYQPEVVRIYTSLLKESKNPTVLEASAGAVQNLCAGRWTVRTIILTTLFHSRPEDRPELLREEAFSFKAAFKWTNVPVRILVQSDFPSFARDLTTHFFDLLLTTNIPSLLPSPGLLLKEACGLEFMAATCTISEQNNLGKWEFKYCFYKYELNTTSIINTA